MRTTETREEQYEHDAENTAGLLVVASIALSVGLALYLTWRMVGETMIRMEEKSFASLMLVEEESLNAAFMNQLAAKVSAVRDRKNQLKETAERASRELATLDKMLPKGETREMLRREMLKSMDSGEIRMELLHMSDLLAGGISRLGLKPDTPDAKQRSLKDILEHLPRSGDFAVMELPRSLTVAGSAFAPDIRSRAAGSGLLSASVRQQSKK